MPPWAKPVPCFYISDMPSDQLRNRSCSWHKANRSPFAWERVVVLRQDFDSARARRPGPGCLGGERRRPFVSHRQTVSLVLSSWYCSLGSPERKRLSGSENPEPILGLILRPSDSTRVHAALLPDSA